MTEARHIARHWSRQPDGRLRCELCPRFCALRDGQRGMCFVRMREGDEIVLDTYGRSSGFCIDPIEKKPLNHFLPGTSVLSFGTAGCNLACKFCQNYDISTAKTVDRLADSASPEALAQAAKRHGCASVAYTYNDPVIFLEYALDTAAACRDLGVRSVAVTAGYIEPEPRAEFFAAMDAANIDLKGFTPEFYRKLTGAHIEPVLDTIAYVAQETECWLELTTLLIPGENDSDAEIEALSGWVLDNCGADTPLHFTAFTPQHRMPDHAATPLETVLRAREIARRVGLHHVYAGNVHDEAAQSSYCTGCGQKVIGRDWHQLTGWHLDETGHCLSCGTRFAGVIEGAPGRWGRKRQPIRIGA
ncbi:AmmeMemoRadiSam system radical SAM enzyme [Sinisalibacter aestuarii]|uniref:AmmeMemoRadiSam system radical SAM enzyme n=1 Tax=Sinisalibacter aestuarii TaxID=2949426 RepID=A0ABQ5LVR6_9RHOB|nr:AmmeMemoRadiSam system radical SAM enzyme [Sinisalibacter aestuarii]GKY89089.1 AmmeMemoRadiSam system radical SAM enzyme [Sinisalibacter aestuarii]